MSAPSGYTRLPSGEFSRDSDGAGPFVYDGSSMALTSTGAGGGSVVVGAASGVVVASDGVSIPIDSLAATAGYDGSNNLTTLTVAYGGNTYKQTFTYTNGFVTAWTAWVKQ